MIKSLDGYNYPISQIPSRRVKVIFSIDRVDYVGKKGNGGRVPLESVFSKFS